MNNERFWVGRYGCALSSKARVTSRALALGAALWSVGCGAAPETSGEDVGTAEEAVAQGTVGWRGWVAEPTFSQTYTGGPAICAAVTTGGAGYAVIGRSATTNRFNISLYQFFTAATAPAEISINTTFSSKPGCASLDELHEKPQDQWNGQIAVLGKKSSSGADNNQFFIRVLQLDTQAAFLGDPPSQPTEVVAWSSISTNTYSSAPAVTVSGGKLMVVGRNGSTLKLHKKTLSSSKTNPYGSGAWSVATLPALPTGWTPAGDPTIANTKPLIGVTQIVTRATSGASTRLYYTLTDGSVFDTWVQLPVTPTLTIQSDPAMEVDLELGFATLYFRANNHIYQGSGYANLWQAFSSIPQSDGTEVNFVDSPAAIGNLKLEAHHFVIAKKSNNQLWHSGTNVGVL